MDILVDRVILSSSFAENKEDAASKVTDVIVILTNGIKYTATFFPYAEIDNIRKLNRQNSDLYIWENNMVLVKNCNQDTVEMVVEHMIDEGDFQFAFRKL